MNKVETMGEGLDNLLKRPSQKKKEAPEREEIPAIELERRSRAGRPRKDGSRERLSTVSTYTSLAVDKNIYRKICMIGELNGLPYKDIVNAALSKYVELYEKKHGEVKTSSESHISATELI